MFKKKHPWYTRRGYLHFDQPIDFSTAQSIVTSPQKVAQRSFHPFVDFELLTSKVKRNPATNKLEKKEKRRPIAYASHVDSHVYSYYSRLLSLKYEEYIEREKIGSSILAFRALDKSNIEFASEAFDEIRKRESCHVLCLDIEGFFNNLNHIELKRAWSDVLGTKLLPDDHFSVFRSLTKHSSVNRDELYGLFGISKNNPKKGVRRICSPEQFRNIVRKTGLIRTNFDPHGIPQGSPISALLSNIYMTGFDINAKRFVENIDGQYFRYCDDMLFIVPIEHQKPLKDFVDSEIKKIHLTIQATKTEWRDFVRVGGVLTTTKPLQYLGFLFDGERVLLRSASLARYFERMKKGVRVAKATMTKRNISRASRGESERALFRKSLYKRYSYLGRRNFVSYGYRAARIMNSKSIRQQLDGLWKRLHNEIAA